ncbi:MAG TPA: T9SS type A sorting domain-containing protein, partial [Flavobacterium sp.]
RYNITNGSATSTIISNSSGDYRIDVSSGNHTITPIFENPGYFNVTPATLNLSFPSQTSPQSQNFCLSANGPHQDLQIVIFPISPARPGFDADYKIIYDNAGTITQSGEVVLTYEGAKSEFVSASLLPSATTLSSMTWNFSNLQPLEHREITFRLNLNTPMESPPVNIGDQLNFTAQINPIAGDEFVQNNILGIKQTVVASMDPNDKTCLQGNVVAPETIGQYVHYVIRFENTGTFAAQNIVVKDMIDTSKFDISTLIPINGSHSFETRITSTNQVEFIFENIMLPFDDATNDGYVAFKIKTLPSLAVGDTFSNNASIYFDYNFPIVTNTATTTIEALGANDFNFSDYFTLYPNPAKDVLYLKADESNQFKSVRIFNIMGQLVLAISGSATNSEIDVSDLKAGNYFIKVSTNKGSSNHRFLKE